MRLELRRDTTGKGLAIAVIGSTKAITIPLAFELSMKLDEMLREEGIQNQSLLIMPKSTRGR